MSDSAQATNKGNESGHTPGPWTVVMRGTRGTFHIKESAINEARPDRVDDGASVAAANARLIAAAPELLEALQKIAAFRPLTFAECSDAEAVIGIAEAAIRKAMEAA